MWYKMFEGDAQRRADYDYIIYFNTPLIVFLCWICYGDMNKSTGWIQHPGWISCSLHDKHAFTPAQHWDDVCYSWAASAGLPTPDSSGPWRPEALCWQTTGVSFHQHLENWIMLICLEQWLSKCGEITHQGVRDPFAGLMRIFLSQFHVCMKLDIFHILNQNDILLHIEYRGRWLQVSFKWDIFRDVRICKIM